MTEAFDQPQRRGFSELPPREAVRRNDLTLVDVRQPEERVGDLGHIPGSIHIPLDLLLTAGPPPELHPDAPTLLICRSGARSVAAAMDLAARGFTQLHNLTGGMVAWNHAGLPVTGRHGRR